MRVDEFVEQALYDPGRGFYETGGRAGRRGASFLTSPEVGPLFGAVIARALDTWWADAGRPVEWLVVDAGAGPGMLARTVLAAEPACGDSLRLISVERSATQRAGYPEGNEVAGELPNDVDVVIANELLDNLPFGMIERTDDGWVEVEVVADGTTRPDSGGPRLPVVARAAAWIGGARRRLRPGGRLVCFDYADTTAALVRQPWTRWVRGFAHQELVADPFVDPGTRDITVVVPHDQLPAPTASSTQADWLRSHGIDELTEEGRAEWNANVAAPDLAALRMRSRIAEAEALLDRDGFGSYWVGEWTG